jgi:hypothetical protein
MLMRNGGLNARLGICLIAVGTCFSLFALSGCERKQRVVDVETPVGDVKVDKGVESGNVDVKVNSK